MQGQIDQAEGNLPAVAGGFGGQAGGLELVDDFLGDFLRRIAIIGGKAVQHPLVQTQFSSICEGASTKSRGTLVPENRRD